MSDASAKVVIYRTDDGRPDVLLRIDDGTVWLPGRPVSAPGPARVIGNFWNAREPGRLVHFLPHLERTLSAETARLKAGQEYEKYQRLLDAQPSSVEQHFDQAVKKAKQLLQPKKPEKGK